MACVLQLKGVRPAVRVTCLLLAKLTLLTFQLFCILQELLAGCLQQQARASARAHGGGGEGGGFLMMLNFLGLILKKTLTACACST